MIHQIRSTREKRDGFHYQIQVLLRSGLPGSSFLMCLLWSSWAWHSNTAKAIPRGLSLGLIALLYTAAMFCAGLFSSRAATAANEVLIQSQVCGFFDDRLMNPTNRLKNFTEDTMASADALGLATGWTYQQSLDYARACYSDVSKSSSSQCTKFAMPRLTSNIDRAAPCPFASGVCEQPAISLQSELIDSHFDLGINAPARDRIRLRRSTACAPIPLQEKYSSGWVDAPPNWDLLPGDHVIYYNVGPQGPFFNGPFSPPYNWTWADTNISWSFATGYNTL